MPRYYIGIFVAALVTLMSELVLTRVFDVIIATNFAYMIITCAMFGLGAAGVLVAVLPPPETETQLHRRIALGCTGAALTLLAMRFLINVSGFDMEVVLQRPLPQVLGLLIVYASVFLPFLFFGFVIISIFNAVPHRSRVIYFWDLVGAGIGCVIFLPFLPLIGPAGVLICGAALMLGVAAWFLDRAAFRLPLAAVALVLFLSPTFTDPAALDFDSLWNKRDVEEDIEGGRREVAAWDVIAKIDVIDKAPRAQADGVVACCWKHVAYDGGNQSTKFYQLKGTPADVRRELEAGLVPISNHFWFSGVLASHYLKRDTGQDVLVIGSAGGQEVKAALMYGAGHVDAIEMVKTVIDLASNQYADYMGNLFHDPKVNVVRGEGRSFLRATDRKYDIIQIFSTYSSSTAAAGGRATGAAFLRTTNAFREYFSHLKPDGILHINTNMYPRLVATAALAWKELGLPADFQAHVAVLERTSVKEDTLPSILIKMTPWTQAELDDLLAEQNSFKGQANPIELVVDPLHRDRSFLSADFFSGDFPRDLAARIPYNVLPTNDDKPFASFMRKNLSYLKADPALFVDRSTASRLNKLMPHHIPFELIHLGVTGVASVVFIVLFIVVPMLFSPAGRLTGRGKAPLIVYFACLGTGFIIFELLAIPIFWNLIGYPLYTYSTVVFTMLLAAGLGSLCSELMGITPQQRWMWPFVAIVVFAAALVLVYPSAIHMALAFPLWGRIATTIALLFPLGFVLGMPFPLGILTVLRLPTGAVAWAWALNAVFTVVGGYLSLLLSLVLGFRLTFLLAAGVYAIGALAYMTLRRDCLEAPEPVAEGYAAAARA